MQINLARLMENRAKAFVVNCHDYSLKQTGELTSSSQMKTKDTIYILTITLLKASLQMSKGVNKSTAKKIGKACFLLNEARS